MAAHEHDWIDITHLGQPYEIRLCMRCNQEERRYVPALATAEGLLADAPWEMVREGVGQSL